MDHDQGVDVTLCIMSVSGLRGLFNTVVYTPAPLLWIDVVRIGADAAMQADAVISHIMLRVEKMTNQHSNLLFILQ